MQAEFITDYEAITEVIEKERQVLVENNWSVENIKFKINELEESLIDEQKEEFETEKYYDVRSLFNITGYGMFRNCEMRISDHSANHSRQYADQISLVIAFHDPTDSKYHSRNINVTEMNRNEIMNAVSKRRKEIAHGEFYARSIGSN